MLALGIMLNGLYKMSNIMKDNTVITKWAIEYLSTHGFVLTLPYEMVCQMPWSQVIRFKTNKGIIYCKQTAFDIEPTIMQILRKFAPDNIPEIIATNKLLNCFLIKDAGNLLRDILKNNYDESLFCKAITAYANIQKAATQHIDLFLQAGALDHRLINLSSLYLQLINKKEFLLKDGLTTDEIDDLYELHPKLVEQCNLLAQYKISDTIEHGDFHDNNILIQG
jgi:hypothetical protein